MICCKVTIAMAGMLFGIIIISSVSVYAAQGGRLSVQNDVGMTTTVHNEVQANTAAATASDTQVVFDVTKYNTIGNGEDDSDDYGLDSQNSVAFRQAWEAACHSPGPAKVLVPQGKFMIARALFGGPCKSPHITFEIQGTLIANPESSFYSGPEWFIFEQVNAITLTGPGIFDATGAYKGGPGTCRSDDPTCTAGPTTIVFNNVTNGIIDGLQSVNAMGFHIFISDSHTVTVRNMRIASPHDVLNSDGVHVERSEAVNITGNIIATGEDCVSIGDGSINVTVTGITCGPGYGISVGNLAKYEVKVHNVSITNCTLNGTEYGARIKHWPEIQGSEIAGITFEDLVMENVKNPIVIDHAPEENPPAEGLHGKITDIHFRNFRGTVVTNLLVNFACTPLMPCDNIEVTDINLAVAGHVIASIAGQATSLAAAVACSNAKVTFGGKHDGLAC